MTKVTSFPPLPQQPNTVAWPTETWPESPVPNSADKDEIQRLLDFAFSNPDELGKTTAFVAVQGGKIVSERYYKGFGQAETYHSWSMAKSMTHALIGIAMGEGLIDLHAPANVPEWQTDGDPRAGITIEHLLRMSSGLEFTEDYEDSGISHTIEMLFGSGKEDVAHYAASKPLEHPIGSFWSYSFAGGGA